MRRLAAGGAVLASVLVLLIVLDHGPAPTRLRASAVADPPPAGLPNARAAPAALNGASATAGDSAERTHEPPGYVPFLETRFDCLPGDDCGGSVGRWWVTPSKWQRTHLSIVVDTTVPTGGNHRVLQIQFPKGLKDGTSPAHFRGWAADGREYRSVYFSEWLRIGGEDGYENQSVGTKLWYLAYGRNNRQNQFFVMLMGHGHQELMREFRLRLDATFEYAPPGSRNPSQDYYANQGAEYVLSTGRWHRLEALMTLNDDGRENGKLEVWVDGLPYASYHTVTYINSRKGATRGFFELNYDPIYGGNSGDVRTRDDFMYVDHIYLSGLPVDQPR